LQKYRFLQACDKPILHAPQSIGPECPMRNWLEKMHSLTAGMLFTHGYVLPFEKVPPPAQVRGREVDESASLAVLRRCAEACRSIVPRLIQPH
jgi:hypothetical protein